MPIKNLKQVVSVTSQYEIKTVGRPTLLVILVRVCLFAWPLI